MNPQYYNWLLNERRRLRLTVHELRSQCTSNINHPNDWHNCDICQTKEKMQNTIFEYSCQIQEIWDEFKNVGK